MTIKDFKLSIEIEILSIIFIYHQIIKFMKVFGLYLNNTF